MCALTAFGVTFPCLCLFPLKGVRCGRGVIEVAKSKKKGKIQMVEGLTASHKYRRYYLFI